MSEAIEHILPLTPTQQGMLFHSDGSADYLVQFVIDLSGSVDPELMRAAWQHVLERHAALRAAILTDEADEPIQALLREVDLPFQVVDWAYPAERDRWLAADRTQGFELLRAPLLRVALGRLPEGPDCLVWTFHHVLLDGWSVSLVLEQVLSGYRRLHAGQPVAAAPVGQFSEFVSWVRDRDRATAEQFWAAELQGWEPNPVHLPGGTGRSGAAELTDHLPEELTRQLTELARRTRSTVSAWLLAAWAQLVAGYSRYDSPIVGVVCSGRAAPLPAIEETVGLLIDTVPVRVPLRPDETATALAQRVLAVQLRAEEHGHVGLVDIVRWSGQPAGTALFDTLYAFENYPVGAADADPGGLRPTGIRSAESAGYPLSLVVTNGRQLGLRLVYEQARCAEQAACTILRLLRRTLEEMVDDPDRAVGRLSRLDPAEAFQAWHGVTGLHPAQTTLPDRLAEQVARQPDRIAVADQYSQLSYAALDRRSRLLAGHLRAAGVGPGDRVGICLARTPALAVAVLAVVRAGAAYLPVDSRYPAERIAHMLADSGARALLTDASTDAVEAPSTTRRIELDQLDWAAQHPDAETVVGPLAAVSLVYTSGSTGRPKGILLTHQGILRTVVGSDHVTICPEDTVTQLCNTSFDPFLWELWGALLNGARLQLVPDAAVLSPQLLAATLRRHQATVSVFPTALLHELGRAAPAAFSGLRELLFGGEAADPTALRAILAASAPGRLQNGYGPAEGTVISSGQVVSALAEAAATVPIGRPVSDTRLYLLDHWLRQVPAGMVGEIAIGGDRLALGYLGKPALTAVAFRPDPDAATPGARRYLTGDLGHRRADGVLEFVGRADNQVKVRGYRVEPAEIEAVLALHPRVRQVAVMPERAPNGALALVAYLAPRDGADLTRIRADLASQVPDYLIPARFIGLPQLPLTPNGKIDRQALLRQRPVDEAVPTAPRTAAERTLASLFATALGRDQVGTDEHFLQLGGDSILAIGVAARAGAAGLTVTAQDVLRLGTPAALAAAAGSGPPAPQYELTGAVPLTPIQHWFDERDLPDPDQFNQAVLLRVPGGCSPQLLARAVRAVLAHHDGLRLRLDRSGPRPVLRHLPPAQVPIEIWQRDHRGAQRLRAVTDELQQRLGLAGDRCTLVAAVFAHPNGDDRLFLAVHHLLVDVISWEALVNDLELAYRQLSTEDEVRLPTKTHSVGQWVEHLISWTGSDAARTESAWWQAHLAGADQVPPLRTDLASTGTYGREGSARTITVELAPREVSALAGVGRLPYLLVTALAWVQRHRTGQQRLLVDLEGHGRQPLAGRLDISRTIGWFTALHPVLIDLSGCLDLPAAAATVSTLLQSVPNGGVGYGVLRQLDPDGLGARLTKVPSASVAVNYVGAFAERVASGGWTLAPEPLGPERAPANPRSHALIVTGHLDQGQLLISFDYSTELHRPETITDLAEEVRGALLNLAGGPQMVGVIDRPLDDVLAEVDFGDDLDVVDPDDRWDR